jgi:hypothetical protein
MDENEILLRASEEITQLRNDRAEKIEPLTRDGLPCPGTCVTLAGELEDVRAELQTEKRSVQEVVVEMRGAASMPQNFNIMKALVEWAKRLEGRNG